MTKDDLIDAWLAGYMAGFDASGEGWNREYPFRDKERHPTEDASFRKKRDDTLAAYLAITPLTVTTT